MAHISQRKNGFTLIELLIVITIILILATILFPVFGRVRENARRASCQSNLKQLGLGIGQYKQDFDERFPLLTVSGTGPYSETNPYGWADAILPYIKSQQILQCPSEITPAGTDPTVYAYTDYWYNIGLGRGNGGSTNIGASDSQLDFPAVTILAGEGLPVSNNPATTNARACQRGGPGQSFAGSTSVNWTRHLSGSNYAFADGHVKWIQAVEGAGVSPVIYRVHHPFADNGMGTTVTGSGESPTFHVSDSITTQQSL